MSGGKPSFKYDPDDPKQRPADNHERIAAAVASASGE